MDPPLLENDRPQMSSVLPESPVELVSPEFPFPGYASISGLQNSCRLCLEEPHPRQLLDMTAIYDQEAKLSYYDCYEICTKEDLRQSPSQEPKSLCSRCAVELHWAYDFHKKVAHANQQLRQIFQSAKPDKGLAEIKLEQEPKPGEVEEELCEVNEVYLLEDIEEEQEQEQVTFQEESQPEQVNGSTARMTETAPRQRHLGKFNCRFCQKEFVNYSRMAKHQTIHLTDRPTFKCSHCNRSYLTMRALKVHAEGKHLQAGISCDICGKVFSVAKALEIHKRYHTKDFPFACDLCDRKFAQRSHLNVHQQVKHTGYRFICEFRDCQKSFTSSASLRNHEWSHTAMPFECSDCQQSFPARNKLRVHLERKHKKHMTVEELEGMRKFRITRSKLVLTKINKEE
ncbi:hypothetical protein KR054_009597 [Drosophila jambulina]|nr:hypothetical protein KR054_009597 [Drosophila jambulina]